MGGMGGPMPRGMMGMGMGAMPGPMGHMMPGGMPQAMEYGMMQGMPGGMPPIPGQGPGGYPAQMQQPFPPYGVCLSLLCAAFS